MARKVTYAVCIFFFNDTATTEIYTLSLHDALPISAVGSSGASLHTATTNTLVDLLLRSEEHTSELQSRRDLVCRLLLEKKNRVRRTQLQAGYAPRAPAHRRH